MPDNGRKAFGDIAPALANGVTQDEMIETITRAFYSGWPTASSALSIARKVFEETK